MQHICFLVHAIPHVLFFIFEHRYHVPKSWFRPSENTLVIFEEQGGDPTKITFGRRRVTTICGYISEDYPNLDLDNWEESIQNNVREGTKMHLKCPEGTSISSIRFASYGNPSGTCESYRQGSCHHPNSISVVEKVIAQHRGSFSRSHALILIAFSSFFCQLSCINSKWKFNKFSASIKFFFSLEWHFFFCLQACLHSSSCSVSFLDENFNKDLCPGIIKALAVEAACS